MIKECSLNVVLLSGDNVCDKEISADCVSVIPGIVVGLAVGLNTDGYGSQQRCVLSSFLFIVDSFLIRLKNYTRL